MGKLADRLKEVTEGVVAGRPIGFRPAGAVQSKPLALALIAGLEVADRGAVETAVRDGAQGVLAPVGPSTAHASPCGGTGTMSAIAG